MPSSISGSVPETSTPDRVAATGGADAVTSPSAETPDLPQDVSGVDADGSVRADPTTDLDPQDVQEAIDASIRTRGVAATEQGILEGTLDVDGRPIGDVVQASDRPGIVGEMRADIEARANEVIPGSSGAVAFKEWQDSRVNPMLQEGYEDPGAAMETLRGLTGEQREALGNGDASALGSTNRGAEIDTNALSVYADVLDQNPDVAETIGRLEAREQAREHLQEMGGQHRDQGPTDYDPERKAGNLDNVDPDLGKQAGHQELDPKQRAGINIQQALWSPHSI